MDTIDQAVRNPDWNGFLKYVQKSKRQRVLREADKEDVIVVLCNYMTHYGVLQTIDECRNKLVKRDLYEYMRKYKKINMNKNTLKAINSDKKLTVSKGGKSIAQIFTGFVNKFVGTLWEKFTIIYLKYCKQYYNIEDIWSIEDAPTEVLNELYMRRHNNGKGKDNGIDLIIKYKNGRYGFVQCKYTINIDKNLNYDTNRIANFVSEVGTTKDRLHTYAKSGLLNKHWLCTNVDRTKLPKNDVFESFMEYSNGNVISCDDWKYRIIRKIIRKSCVYDIVVPTAKIPLQWQQRALPLMFNDGKPLRGQIVMPTGTGKTLLIPMFIGYYKIKMFVVFEPVNFVLQQNAEEMLDWLYDYYDKDMRKKSGIKGFKILLATSDKYMKSAITNPDYPINITCTTDYDIVTDWIEKATDDRYIYGIFSTYHQQTKIVRAFVQNKTQPEMVCCDEAHQALCNKKRKDIKYDEDDEDDDFVDSIKYCPVLHKDFDPTYMFFTTATPEKNKNKKKLTSMSDKRLFGKVIYSMSIHDAIHTKGLLCDYDIASILAKEKWFNIDASLKYDSEQCKLDIYARLLTDFLYNGTIKKCIVYLEGKKDLKFFHKRLEYFLKKKELDDFYICTVTCETDAYDRNKLKRKMEKHTYGILLNIRICISGINIPCVDGIFYAKPITRESHVIQSLGRGLRKDKHNPDKKLHVFVPFLSALNEKEESGVIDRSLLDILNERDSDKFKHMCAILTSLENNSKDIYDYYVDYRQGDMIKSNIQFLIAKGNGKSSSVKTSKLSTEEMQELLGEVYKTFVTRVWDKTGKYNISELLGNYENCVLRKILIESTKSGKFTYQDATTKNIRDYIGKPSNYWVTTTSKTPQRSASQKLTAVILQRKTVYGDDLIMRIESGLYRLLNPFPSIEKIEKMSDVKFVTRILVDVYGLFGTLPPKPFAFERGTRLHVIYRRYKKCRSRMTRNKYSPEEKREMIEALPNYFV